MTKTIQPLTLMATSEYHEFMEPSRQEARISPMGYGDDVLGFRISNVYTDMDDDCQQVVVDAADIHIDVPTARALHEWLGKALADAHELSFPNVADPNVRRVLEASSPSTEDVLNALRLTQEHVERDKHDEDVPEDVHAERAHACEMASHAFHERWDVLATVHFLRACWR